MAPTVYLVSGANRGIGFAIVTQLASRPDTIVFAGARNPSASSLQALSAQYPGKVHAIKLTSADKADNDAALAEVQKVAGRLDVVIANAGASAGFAATGEVPLGSMRADFEINVLGPLSLFQSAYPLLKASAQPKFIIVSSNAGSIELGPAMPIKMVAYGVSKAGVNWLAAKLWHEYPPLVAFPIHPGTVRTDMSEQVVKEVPSFAEMPMLAPEESARGILKVVDEAKRDEKGPRFMSYDGSVLPW